MRSVSGSQTSSWPARKPIVKARFSGGRRAACGFARCIDLKQRQPRMIEKGTAGCGQRDAAGDALQQWDTDFEFEVADVPAQRWLRGMEPPLRGIGQAAFLGNGETLDLSASAITKESCRPSRPAVASGRERRAVCKLGGVRLWAEPSTLATSVVI